MAKRPKLSAGDVFHRQLPDGRYGAVRILKVGDESSVVSTTRYLADVPPTADVDDALLRPVIRNSFSWNEVADVHWLVGNPCAGFEFAFNRPLTAIEAKFKCESYGTRWSLHEGIGAYVEWRWIHDRERLQAEVDAEQALQREARERERLKQKPKRMLAEDAFWTLIGRLDWTQTGDDEAVMAPLVNHLAAMTKTEIRGFQERLAYCLYRLDTRAHARQIGSDAFVDEDTHFSADAFLYARCCAVANGQVFYETALVDPTQMPKDLEFEALLNAADLAWEQKTGEGLEHDTGCSYESFSNVEGWRQS